MNQLESNVGIEQEEVIEEQDTESQIECPPNNEDLQTPKNLESQVETPKQETEFSETPLDDEDKEILGKIVEQDRREGLDNLFK